MPLTACMIVVDNSESSRNGDFQPSRFDAQADSVNIIAEHVLNDNPESSVGLMSMGGKGPEVLTTLATERGKILSGLHRTKKNISGSCHLSTAIQIASVCCLPLSSCCFSSSLYILGLFFLFFFFFFLPALLSSCIC